MGKKLYLAKNWKFWFSWYSKPHICAYLLNSGFYRHYLIGFCLSIESEIGSLIMMLSQSVKY